MTDHKKEQRTREILEYFCADEGCEFFGKHSQQGVCHTAEGEIVQLDRLYDIAKKFADDLRLFRTEHYTDKDEYILWLESMYECTSLNWTFTLDECVRLRRELALLMVKLDAK
jgi:hypothetical protein